MFVPESALNSEIVAKNTRSTRGSRLNVGTRLTALCTTLARQLMNCPLPRRHCHEHNKILSLHCPDDEWPSASFTSRARPASPSHTLRSY